MHYFSYILDSELKIGEKIFGVKLDIYIQKFLIFEKI